MADFIAVIRRAVDGLSENTPEMRQKVYERARSAVVRQLENMKPRPPEAMFQRQLDKLDAAIREVEAEHTAARPSPQDTAAETASPEVGQEPAEPAEAAAEPVHHAEPVAEPQHAAYAPHRTAEEQPVHHEPAVHEEEPARTTQEEEPVHHQPAFEPITPAQVAETAAPASAEHRVEDAPASAEALAEEPAEVPHYASEPDHPPFAEPAAHLAEETRPAQLELPEETSEVATSDHPDFHPATAGAAAAGVSIAGEAVNLSDDRDRALAADNLSDAGLFTDDDQPQKLEEASDALTRTWASEADYEPPALTTSEARPTENTPVMPKAPYDESDVVAGFNEFVQHEINRKVVPPPPGRAHQAHEEKQEPPRHDDFAWDAPFDDLPDLPKHDTFEEALAAKQRELAARGEAKATETENNTEPATARDELEELIGLPRQEPAAGRRAARQDARAANKLQQRPLKTQKKKGRKRFFKLLPAALGLGALVVVGGGAFSAWYFKDDLSNLVASWTPSTPAEEPANAQEEDAAASETRSATVTPEEDQAVDAETPARNTEVAALDPDPGPRKFTQRLLPDGTETDPDADQIPVDEALGEGKSVSGQTEKGKEVAGLPAENQTTNTSGDNKPAESAQPIGVTQKMFLYEERLGQTSPVATEGTIVWREKTDTENGRPNPAIEAELDIPARKLKGLITIKRNTDESLPASHIIEIVFDLPQDFPEGNIESVQRIAFKQTEQDRGNPLIAVPAKITDDFHMVALNDDADARRVNTELMKTRSWIDIPITYRNGRRALITLEKGSSGTAVFDKVMNQWSALGAQSSN